MSSAAPAPAVPTRAEPERLTRKRAIAVWTLLVVASILLLLSSLTVWVKRQALDTDAWTNASGQMLANDEIRQQLSIYLVDTLLFSSSGRHRTDPAGAPGEPRRACTDHQRRARRTSRCRPPIEYSRHRRLRPCGRRRISRAHTNLIQVLEGKARGSLQTTPGTARSSST